TLMPIVSGAPAPLGRSPPTHGGTGVSWGGTIFEGKSAGVLGAIGLGAVVLIGGTVIVGGRMYKSVTQPAHDASLAIDAATVLEPPEARVATSAPPTVSVSVSAPSPSVMVPALTGSSAPSPSPVPPRRTETRDAGVKPSPS